MAKKPATKRSKASREGGKLPTAKKKPARKKKPTTSQTPLPTMEDEFDYPAEVTDRVKTYVETLREKNEVTAENKTAKENCIEAMKDSGLEKVRYEDPDGNWKWLVLNETNSLKIKSEKKKEDQTDQ